LAGLGEGLFGLVKFGWLGQGLGVEFGWLGQGLGGLIQFGCVRREFVWICPEFGFVRTEVGFVRTEFVFVNTV